MNEKGETNPYSKCSAVFSEKYTPAAKPGTAVQDLGSLVRSIIPSSSNNQRGKWQKPDASSTMLTLGTSGYTSDECSEA
ncbi:hypothetical protein M5K25_018071 [Dendrobium thyrsiflorum]|uniref:Uncharacterized protein n=1 Tax=Dendrobium thyrsiflorum TaxID=117978 RepID=A0ABD0UHA8_DENTH